MTVASTSKSRDVPIASTSTASSSSSSRSASQTARVSNTHTISAFPSPSYPPQSPHAVSDCGLRAPSGPALSPTLGLILLTHPLGVSAQYCNGYGYCRNRSLAGGIIAGIVVAVVVGLLLFALLPALLMRRRRRQGLSVLPGPGFAPFGASTRPYGGPPGAGPYDNANGAAAYNAYDGGAGAYGGNLNAGAYQGAGPYAPPAGAPPPAEDAPPPPYPNKEAEAPAGGFAPPPGPPPPPDAHVVGTAPEAQVAGADATGGGERFGWFGGRDRGGAGVGNTDGVGRGFAGGGAGKLQ